jgi:hypothetical protein
MSIIAQQSAFQSRIAISPTAIAVAAARRFFRALFDNAFLARQRQAQRDIDLIVSHRDGRFTDSLEREIAERSYSGADDGFRGNWR